MVLYALTYDVTGLQLVVAKTPVYSLLFSGTNAMGIFYVAYLSEWSHAAIRWVWLCAVSFQWLTEALMRRHTACKMSFKSNYCSGGWQ